MLHCLPWQSGLVLDQDRANYIAADAAEIARCGVDTQKRPLKDKLMAKTLSKALIALAVLGGIGAGVYYYGMRDEAPQWRTASVQRGDIAVTVLAAGAIEAKQLVSVGARVSGQIETLAVRLGQDVKAGDMIAQIDRQEQENDLLRSKAALAQIDAQIIAKSAGLRKAETTLTRQKQLGAEALVSQEALENAASSVEVLTAELAALNAQRSSAKVNVAQSQLALERTTITAPIDGTVVALVVEAGQTVSAAQNAPTIVKIANLDTMIIKAEVSEADVVRVLAGQKASFTILGEPDRQFDAVVRDVEPAPEGLAASDNLPADKAIYFNGLLEVANPDRQLRIGMTAQVSIVLDAATDVTLVPVSAVQQQGNRSFVQVMANGQPVERDVTTGLNDKVNIEIRSGLNEGDTVVLGAAAGGGTSDGGGQSQGPGGPPIGR
jgi:macrolide-specific efflux system membrane fusion protein